MKNNTFINEVVAITMMGFKKNLSPYPRRMEFRGVVYDFIDAGLRCLVNRGGHTAEVITLSDGHAYYHLRSDNHGGNWTLLSIEA